MDTTRTIQVFLASSDELKNDRNTFGNLIRRLDNIYEKRGIRIKLVEWEDCDAAYNNLRKQDEYNVEVKASDMFLALFYKKAGKFTVEEFDVATKEFQRTGIKPKPYVYCRDLPEGEQESEELKEFKRRLFEEMGHYWSQYNNEDSLQLHFVMQLQLVENSRLDNLKVENGEVKLEDSPIARMEHLRFAADNPDYQRMSHRLHELTLLIEKARLRIEKYPNDQDLVDDLQKLLNEKNQLQEDFDQHQQLLFDTAKRIATLQGESAPESISDALDAVMAAKEPYDSILILRGGGSNFDLACFDDYGLCFNIANCDIPVFTAIGHDRDHHVADLVAYQDVKTPTALADLFLDAYRAEDERISQYITRLRLAFVNKVNAMASRVELLASRIQAADPRGILARGYALATDGRGVVLKSAAGVEAGDKVNVLFADGRLNCTVDGKV